MCLYQFISLFVYLFTFLFIYLYNLSDYFFSFLYHLKFVICIRHIIYMNVVFISGVPSDVTKKTMQMVVSKVVKKAVVELVKEVRQ